MPRENIRFGDQNLATQGAKLVYDRIDRQLLDHDYAQLSKPLSGTKSPGWPAVATFP